MKPGVDERKWEIDSLFYAMRLSHEYWTRTRDKAPFDETWSRAMKLAVATFREQQRKDGPGPYKFQRPALQPSDSLMLRSEEHTSELQSLMRISYAVFCLKKNRTIHPANTARMS